MDITQKPGENGTQSFGLKSIQTSVCILQSILLCVFIKLI